MVLRRLFAADKAASQRHDTRNEASGNGQAVSGADANARNDRGGSGNTRSTDARRGGMITILSGALAFLGVCALLYPMAASWVSQYNQSKVIISNLQGENAATKAQDSREIALARAYNSKLSTGAATYKAENNAPTSSADKSLHSLYESALSSDGGVMARIQIPAIDLDLPVYHGTDDATLLKGIGHLEGTSMPVGGEGTHAVLTGHRGLANATMFTYLNKVKDGDEFTISTFGDVLTYRVIRTQVVDPDQTKSLRPVAGQDLVTLVTCTPLGINTQRIFVTGQRVYPTPVAAVNDASKRPTIPKFPWWMVMLFAAIVLDAAYLRISLSPWRQIRHAAWRPKG